MCGGYVVLNDVWHPWWTATVDGKPADILTANVLFRAVEVTPGRHQVRFEFKPVEGAIAELSERIFGDEAEVSAAAVSRHVELSVALRTHYTRRDG